MTRTTLIFLLMIMLVPVAAANEIVIQSDGDQHYLTLIASDSLDVAGYNIQLNYSSDTRILNIEPLEPYTGVSQIENDDGWAQVVGFTGGDTYSARLAGFTYTGKGNFSIIVHELCDSDLNDVAVSNAIDNKHSVPDLPTPKVPEYQPNPGYVSPVAVAGRPTSVVTELPASSGLVSVPSPEIATSVTPFLPSVGVEERSAPTLMASPEATTPTSYPQTAKAQASRMLVIAALIITAFCFVNIRKHI